MLERALHFFADECGGGILAGACTLIVLDVANAVAMWWFS